MYVELKNKYQRRCNYFVNMFGGYKTFIIFARIICHHNGVKYPILGNTEKHNLHKTQKISQEGFIKVIKDCSV